MIHKRCFPHPLHPTESPGAFRDIIESTTQVNIMLSDRTNALTSYEGKHYVIIEFHTGEDLLANILKWSDTDLRILYLDLYERYLWEKENHSA